MKDPKQTLSVVRQQQTTPLPTFLECLAKWMTVFTHVYRQPMTEATVWAYRETLKDLTAAEVDRGCMESMKRTKFTPTPAEIREFSKEKVEHPALNALAIEDAPLSLAELQELVKEAKRHIQ